MGYGSYAFTGKECLLLCGVSDDRYIGFSFVRWLFGGCMVGLLVILFVPVLLLFLAMPGLCRFPRVTPITVAVHHLTAPWLRHDS